jgi:hypothetical protein
MGVEIYAFGDVGIEGSFDRAPMIYDTESIERWDLDY